MFVLSVLLMSIQSHFQSQEPVAASSKQTSSRQTSRTKDSGNLFDFFNLSSHNFKESMIYFVCVSGRAKLWKHFVTVSVNFILLYILKGT